MKFICKNKKCEKFGVEYEYLSNRYTVIDGALRSNNAPCPTCGSIREEFNPNEVPLSEKNIDIGKYSSASKQGKREMLKKRSHDHFKKEIQPFKEHQLRETVRNFKEAGKN